MYTCGPMTHVFPKLTPSIVAPRDQDKESKRSWMTGGWELCVAQAVQTLCSHEEGHIVQSANLCQLKDLSLKGTCFGKEGCTPVLPLTSAGILEQPTSSTRVKHYRFTFSGIIGIFWIFRYRMGDSALLRISVSNPVWRFHDMVCWVKIPPANSLNCLWLKQPKTPQSIEQNPFLSWGSSMLFYICVLFWYQNSICCSIRFRRGKTGFP